MTAGVIGWILAYVLWGRPNDAPERVRTGNGRILYELFSHKFYWDELYHYTVYVPVAAGARFARRFVERPVFQLPLDFLGPASRVVSRGLSVIQNGRRPGLRARAHGRPRRPRRLLPGAGLVIDASVLIFVPIVGALRDRHPAALASRRGLPVGARGARRGRRRRGPRVPLRARRRPPVRGRRRVDPGPRHPLPRRRRRPDARDDGHDRAGDRVHGRLRDVGRPRPARASTTRCCWASRARCCCCSARAT